jgi:selenocysteine lyase/cysteine desulfurase
VPPTSLRGVELPDAAARFAPGPGYLDTATVGIPAAEAVDAMAADLADWRAGRLAPARYDDVVDACRAAYARIVGASPDRVGIVGQASVASAVAASALRGGDRVVLAEEDFTSVLFPFLQLEAGGVEVVVVPLDRVLDAAADGATMVAVSAVQSADGRVLDLDALVEVAASTGCLTYVDLTQAAGWLRTGADRFSLTSCGAYKWLCSPRGTGFTTVDPAAAERFTPVAAGWYAGEDRWASIYGPPLRLAPGGRRFDTSPAWHSWVGARPTLELLADVGAAAVEAHDVALADAFLAAIGEPPAGSAIATVDRPGALEALRAAGIRCAGRAGRARLAFHLYSTADDVDRAAEALAGTPPAG